MSKSIETILRSMPLVDKLDLPPRAEILPKIESGELDHIDFRARVFVLGPNRNYFAFRAEDMPSFARSFEGQPFLRNHDSYDIDSRDGSIVESSLQGDAIIQDIRLTTRRGMTDFVEGKIDRFSVGFWDYKAALCTICNNSYLSLLCNHIAGRRYTNPETGITKLCEILFVEPKGRETSAVNSPAVPGTGVETALDDENDLFTQKLEMFSEEIKRLTVTQSAQSDPSLGQEPQTVDESEDLDQVQAHQAYRSRRLALSKSLMLEGESPMNVRELMKQRAGLIEQAQALHNTAESESRDLTEEERVIFTALMDQADALKGQIETIQAERARLSEAINSLADIPAEPEKPAPGQQAASMKRAEYNALSVAEQAKFVQGGGAIVE